MSGSGRQPSSGAYDSQSRMNMVSFLPAQAQIRSKNPDKSIEVNRNQFYVYLEKRPLERNLLLAALEILFSSWHVLDLKHGEHPCFRVTEGWDELRSYKMTHIRIDPFLVGPFIENPPSKYISPL